MNPILSIVSVRVKSLHIDPKFYPDQLAITEFSSINKAKAKSKELGGLGKVRAFNDMKLAKAFIQEFQLEDTRVRLASALDAWEVAASKAQDASDKYQLALEGNKEKPNELALTEALQHMEKTRDAAYKARDEYRTLQNKFTALGGKVS